MKKKQIKKKPIKKPKPQCKHCGSPETFNVIFFWDEKDLAQTEYECMECTEY